MKKWAIVLLVLGVVAAGAFLFWSRPQAPTAAAMVDLETARVETGSLNLTISAIGEVRAGQTATLVWKTSGTVSEVAVALGDTVETGEKLSWLEQVSLPQSVINAQAELANAQKALEDLYTQAERQKTQALYDISTYAEQVKETQYQLDNFTVPSNQANMDSIEAYDVMRARLDEARVSFEPFKYYSENNSTRQERKEKLDEAQADLNAAVKRLEYEYAVEVAQANLDQARADYATYQDGPDPREVAAAEARIAAAEATLKQAWIEAPFAGTLTRVEPQSGDQVNAGEAAFRLDDLSQLFIDVNISEIDISQIAPGQAAVISIDARRGQEYHGEVVKLTPVGTAGADGLVDFEVTIVLNNPDAAVLPGMTAEVEIEVKKDSATLLVPNGAIRVENGVQVVYVLSPGGEPKPVEVTLGISSDTHSQVLSGDLEAGQQVVINMPGETEQQTPGILAGPRRMMNGGDSGDGLMSGGN